MANVTYNTSSFPILPSHARALSNAHQSHCYDDSDFANGDAGDDLGLWNGRGKVDREYEHGREH